MIGCFNVKRAILAVTAVTAVTAEKQHFQRLNRRLHQSRTLLY